MKKCLVFVLLLPTTIRSYAQITASPQSGDWKTLYRESPEKVTELVHTRLDVRLDFAKSYLHGKAWVTLKPHFYASDSVVLDAKGMDIHKVSLLKKGNPMPVKYNYSDKMHLRVKLDKAYKPSEQYTIFVDYTAKPDEVKLTGSAAIKDAKGLYFINPKGETKDKPTEVWTQGETEASSVWFPTIDKINQKMTQEIAMTVPSKFVTLSNGKLISQKKNTDGTRTDLWKMDLPHSPYLVFMAAGPFAVVKDSYKGKEVSYYVEKEYEKVARRIFGSTPEMMQFFSSKLGVEYPWVKYAQVTGRDYVSGAMENTTATLHSDYLQQNARELTDGNKYEEYISHELFHQWFGNLVTAESWSNLTVNESFADYAETLWFEYKYGNEKADHHNYNQLQLYLNSRSESKHLVRFYYRDKEDMFDRVSYQKGGRILNMLRHFIGDDAFFTSLKLYLNRHRFKTAEAHDLRLAFEEVTGKDLNWFFNQWYFNYGHPKLSITYGYNDSLKVATVFVKQTQDSSNIFVLPVTIDIYSGTDRTRYNIWLNHQSDSFSFPVTARPDLINFDADKILLTEKIENKTIYNYVYQYKSKSYVDRREAVDYAARHKFQFDGKKLLLSALKDPYYELRERALKNLNASDLDSAAILEVERIAKQDPKRTTRAAAIDVLAEIKQPAYATLFADATKDSSYSVAGAALLALAALDRQKATSLLPQLKKDMKGRLKTAVEQVETFSKGDSNFEEMARKFDEATGLGKLNQYKLYLSYLGNVNITDSFKKGIDKVIEFRNALANINPRAKQSINDQLSVLRKQKVSLKRPENAAAIDEQVRYIDEKLK